MRKTANIQVRIDPETKDKAQEILDRLHLPLSQAVGMFLRQIIYHNGLPFPARIPNHLTAKTLEDSEKGVDVHEAPDPDALFEDLAD